MNLKKTLKIYQTLIPKRERYYFILITLLMFVTAFTETFSIGAIFPFMALVIDPSGVSHSGNFMELILSTGKNIFGQQFVIILALVLFLTFVTKNLLLYFLIVFENKVIFRNMTHSETKLFNGYLEAPYLSHLNNNTANLIRNVTFEVGAVFNSVLRSVLSIAVDVMTIFAILFLLMIVSPVITLVTLFSLGLASYLFNWVSGTWLAKYGLVRQQAAAKLIQWVNQGLGAIREIKVLGCEDYFVHQYKETAILHRNAEARFNSLAQIPKLFFEVLAVTAMLALIVIFSWSGSSQQNVIPLIAMYSLAGMRLAPAFNRIMGQVAVIKYYQSSMELVSQEFNQLTTHREITLSSQTLSVSPATKGLSLNQVDFRYPNQEKNALREVTFGMAPNEAIGIIGESGAGKTTLINIILGLISPAHGTVSIEGIALSEAIKKKNRFIGYVPQEIYLSDDTIKNNVAYGLHPEKINEEKVWKALALARLDTFIKSLPEGLDTLVGERGARISGGQKQRIGIARALYSDPTLLILDEPTSALDSETEKEIASAIDEISIDKMVIIVTHRQGLLQHCDRIYRMTDGRLAEIQIDLTDQVPLGMKNHVALSTVS